MYEARFNALPCLLASSCYVYRDWNFANINDKWHAMSASASAHMYMCMGVCVGVTKFPYHSR